jgi:hypothetical protein
MGHREFFATVPISSLAAVSPPGQFLASRTDLPPLAMTLLARSAVAIGLYLLALAGLPVSAASQEAGGEVNDSTSRYFFYRPEIDYGSAAFRGPLETFANRGLSNLVLVNRSRVLSDVNWRAGWRETWRAMRHPRWAIEEYGGFRKWFGFQFWPEDGKIWQWAWVPNYGGHILAGGISYRYMAEWFHARGVRYPKLTAGVWLMGTMLTNEVVENNGGSQGHHNAVADIYFFDPLSIVVFSFDGVARFFGGTLQAADWSPMASLTLPDGRIMNHGQLMAYKVPLPFTDRARMLFLIGLGAASGPHFQLAEGYGIAATVGFDAKVRHVDPTTGIESIEADYGGGLYLDRNNSVLASVVLSKRHLSRLSVNVYPGVLPGRLRPLGLWINQSQGAGWSLGIAGHYLGGLGIGWDFFR